jgi:hypothetical protein
VKDIAEMKLLHYEKGADYIARAETRLFTGYYTILYGLKDLAFLRWK